MNDGILLIDKSEGMGSRNVDNRIQKIFKTRKVGHLGTLDPFATGLLIVGVNKGNKCLTYLDSSKKTYIAQLELGKETSTGDYEGETLGEFAVPSLSKESVFSALKSFLGKSEQIPPMTSAIKVNGTALYELAHKGEEIERKPRPIEIFEMELVSFNAKQIIFLATVSSGTYIRVLGEDIAKKLGTRGYLSALRRTKVGDISVKDAIKLEDVTQESLLNPLPFFTIPTLEVDDDNAKKIKNGMTVDLPSQEPILAISYKQEALAIYQKASDGHYHCLRGLF